ncbi:MAG: ornithine carbamoyltransferase, partial [Vicinamibacteria bacterium]
MNKDFLSIEDLTRGEIENLLDLAAEMKEDLKKGRRRETLAGKSLGLLFEKPSLRTRVTFEVGMIQLGGFAVTLE